LMKYRCSKCSVILSEMRMWAILTSGSLYFWVRVYYPPFQVVYIYIYIWPVGDSRESGNLTLGWTSQQGSGVRSTEFRPNNRHWEWGVVERGRRRYNGLRTASVGVLAFSQRNSPRLEAAMELLTCPKNLGYIVISISQVIQDSYTSVTWAEWWVTYELWKPDGLFWQPVAARRPRGT
jgi:hypothetical protein